MTYQETIEYLYSMLPVFHRDGEKAFKGSLHNILELCEHLGNPQNKFKSIHIGGTNGKGSTSHYLAAILQSAGYKTALYTSPHLKDYSERFRINGISIDKANIISFIESNKSIIELIRPSFFELSVALAFDYFAKEQVDIAVIEVGLGGRLDSTNIITPILSVITNIGFDHVNILGNTLPQIAFEKAGIIKKNVPVVISEYHPETALVFKKKAFEESAPIIFSSDNIKVIDKEINSTMLLVDVFYKNELLYSNLESELIGKYQLKNIAGVIQSIFELRKIGLKISDDELLRGISNVVKITSLKGRWQILSDAPLMICDTAHNEHGLSIVLDQIEKLKVSKKYFILGFVKDKNVDEILGMFPKEAEYIFCQAETPRSLASEDLIKIANKHQLSGYSILNVNEAIEIVKKKATNEDLIYIGGSTFVVAEILNL
ncbi:FolC bifunctional protein [Emticicia oligotrophica DSM 17448]|uniref:Dihydrofolate synthase/folylpolyglutamate synthase n=1 Tax=Emticicia oligotrophica (strain DSM 17448 / CIP 109782 / MTCC 6937 / GPTSA100-15) TaxID=929562 RepID=A0ABM5N766_EMTOG|nr:folylpolyglutamate synthase/dihydrofolate synthase family protein [Emticicia oligotrophica]AFK05322.1 FolC bifunctional protein [Emticicia oligotrophica DSM 17448]